MYAGLCSFCITMRTLFTSLCIISSLLSTGDFLQCEECHSDEADCKGDTKICSPGTKPCTTFLVEVTIDGSTDTKLSKSCGGDLCNETVSLTAGLFRSRARSVCCTKDLCNSGPTAFPEIDTKENGLTCPSCFASSPDLCKSADTVKCTGPEDRCVRYTDSIFTGFQTINQTVHGCVSKNVCEAMAKGEKYLELGQVSDFECTTSSSSHNSNSKSSSSLPHQDLLFLVSSLLLLKLNS
ncbi:phospholipase A2 inhibitor and Ly6/PLAUR domain-containing protein-like [Rhinatrema bivittatum]|uniref:phospholipase A2 inhibitor and Ly6/PLAUR domain-containing protein-like n=1 Tax=Rhinatrema bivittatum TaxID=194408 RepID=UPI001129281A|nr:phospholipase A2 inhibitor and Ly6/PLAUR domain-containing protein-like [Rhinatrema bivittatum]